MVNIEKELLDFAGLFSTKIDIFLLQQDIVENLSL